MINFDPGVIVAAIKEMSTKISAAAGESAMRRAAVAGAAIIRDEAIVNAAANRKTGTISRNIIIKHLDGAGESDGNIRQEYLVTVRSGKDQAEGDAYYWRFVEDGHRNIRKGKSKKDTLKRRRIEALEFGTSRTPAYPFMRPAFESKKTEAVNAMADRLQQEIAEALK